MSGDAPRRLVLLGHPVGHSLSARFQNAALDAAGIAIRYEALDVVPDDLPRVLEELRAQRAAGNVTVPHKEAVAAGCARLSATARRTGAVNTFRTATDGTLDGHNTDVAGFQAMADSLGVVREGARVVCLGAGGAAAAVCAAVEAWPRVSVRLLARTSARALSLAARFGFHVSATVLPAEALADATVIVNATPAGLADDDHPVALSVIPRDACVMDLVYRPGETAWVRAARTRGHRAADGREMLLHQGAAAFEIWFGIQPDLRVMRAALEHALGT
ncbi:MAG: shikimate dehydrogenase [Gemmatimonadaceae bacterium]